MGLFGQSTEEKAAAIYDTIIKGEWSPRHHGCIATLMTTGGNLMGGMSFGNMLQQLGGLTADPDVLFRSYDKDTTVAWITQMIKGEFDWTPYLNDPTDFNINQYHQNSSRWQQGGRLKLW